MVNATSTTPADVNERTQNGPRRRWVKVEVDEQTFLTMHDCANKSRKRVALTASDNSIVQNCGDTLRPVQCTKNFGSVHQINVQSDLQ